MVCKQRKPLVFFVDTASRSDLTIKKTAEAPSETSNAQKESMESSTAEDRGEDMPILGTNMINFV